jgi:carbonic anhydrase
VLKSIKDAFPDKPKVNLDLSEFLDNDQPFDFWYYLGSATIPPCRDGALEWIVSKKVMTMGQEERDFFWGLFNNDDMKGNYRNLQPLRGNKIDYYHFSSL